MKIEHIVQRGILVSVMTSDWATAVVPVQKYDGSIRLFVDYKVTVNKYLDIEEYPILHVDTILAKTGDTKIHSKFDNNEAYMHVPINYESSLILTINTSKSIFRVTRLMYGVASALAIFQRVMKRSFANIKGLQVFFDDFTLSSINVTEHIEKMRDFLQRFR